MSNVTSPPVVSADTLRAALERGDNLTVLDVRTAADRAEWAIPGSVHVDAYERLKAGDRSALDGLDLPDGRPVVTVCGAGKTSLIAADLLRERGLDARSLAGGMKAWSLAWNVAEVALAGSTARVLQVRRTGKGCLSYLIGAAGQALVIDTALDPDVYLDLAAREGWHIVGVVDTHIHADHLSRSRALAAAAGVTLHLPDQQRVAFPFAPLHEGDGLRVGDVTLVALHTPGHTGESMCYLLDGRALFTGDTLFLAGVGRPDLEANAGEARERAHALYGSLHSLLALPPETLILPGHTSEPVPFDDVPIAASLAQIRERVTMLGLSEEAFVTTILARIPPTPPNHQQIVELNESGRAYDGDVTDLEAGANRCAVS